MKKKRNLSDIFHYLLGHYRYFFYYGDKWSKKFHWIANLRKKFIRTHIKEQIAWRIEVMDRDCYNQGSCKLCGCETTALQMANKSCDKPCYPPMMTKAEWELFKITIHAEEMVAQTPELPWIPYEQWKAEQKWYKEREERLGIRDSFREQE